MHESCDDWYVVVQSSTTLWEVMHRFDMQYYNTADSGIACKSHMFGLIFSAIYCLFDKLLVIRAIYAHLAKDTPSDTTHFTFQTFCFSI